MTASQVAETVAKEFSLVVDSVWLSHGNIDHHRHGPASYAQPASGALTYVPTARVLTIV